MKKVIIIIFLGCVALLMSFGIKERASYKIKTVVIDAGHGGHDHGCKGAGSKEKDIALKERKRYLDHGHGQTNQEYGFRAYPPLYKGLPFAINQAIHPLAREGEAKTKKSWNSPTQPPSSMETATAQPLLTPLPSLMETIHLPPLVKKGTVMTAPKLLKMVPHPLINKANSIKRRHSNPQDPASASSSNSKGNNAVQPATPKSPAITRNGTSQGTPTTGITGWLANQTPSSGKNGRKRSSSAKGQGLPKYAPNQLKFTPNIPPPPSSETGADQQPPGEVDGGSTGSQSDDE